MTDRYNLHQFYSGEASEIKYRIFEEPTQDVYDAENIKIVRPTTTMTKKALVRIEGDWIETLPKLNKAKALSIASPKQDLFTAACQLPNLEKLFIFSSKINDISSIVKLSKLRRLQFSSCTQLTDILPVIQLKNLELLSFENCFRVQNYDVIGKIPSLTGLELCGDPFAPKRLQVISLKPFTPLKGLKHLDLSSALIIDKSYECILELENLERLDLLAKMPKEVREKIKSNHKNLKAGFFMDYDFEKNKFYDGKDWEVS